MELIDLLNKIVNKEVLPFKIKYSNHFYALYPDGYFDINDDSSIYDRIGCCSDLNKRIEIIEERK